MEALTDERVAQALPPFDRPTLYIETASVPDALGYATAGTEGALPQMVAFEPPYAGNGNWTVGLEGALGGAPAVLAYGPGEAPTGGIAILGAQLFVCLDPAPRTRLLGALDGIGAGEGTGSLCFAIPEIALGSTFYFQWIVLDPGAVMGLAATDAAAVTVF